MSNASQEWDLARSFTPAQTYLRVTFSETSSFTLAAITLKGILSKTEVEVVASVYEGQVFAKSGNSGFQSPGNPYAAHLHVDGANSAGKMINLLEPNYGRVTNAEFFETYHGDYKKNIRG